MKASTQILIIGPGRLGQCMYRWLTAAGRSVRLIGNKKYPALLRGSPYPTEPFLRWPNKSLAEVGLAASGPPIHSAPVVHKIGLHPLMTFTGTEKDQTCPTIPGRHQWLRGRQSHRAKSGAGS